ncbi:MAG: ADP-dependent glucokinase/phosphofructokinase [Thermomicrobiales bacterium]
MAPSAWPCRYRAALERAQERAATAAATERRIACAFTSNVDRVATLDAALLERLYEGRLVDGSGPRVTRADTVEELLVGIAQCIVAGDGTDLPIPAGVQAWLLERMGGRAQVGGTGAQAAATLATLGFPVLLQLTGRSPEQLSALPHHERMMVGAASGLIPLDDAVDPGAETMWHPVLEFAAGLPAPVPGQPPAPAPNRVLIRHDPVNAAFRVDPGFDAALSDPHGEISALLISGFSQLEERAIFERTLWDVAVAVQVWRAVRPGMLVHLELGAMPEAEALLRLLDLLHPVIDSLGMNIDELRQILSALGQSLAAPGPDLVAQVACLAERYPVPRLSVHTREFCLTITRNDPDRERDALLFGSLVAGTRARIGAFPTFADLETTLTQGETEPAGLAMMAACAAEIGANGQEVVITPGYRNEETLASVGLGDSFSGGVLAMLP